MLPMQLSTFLEISILFETAAPQRQKLGQISHFGFAIKLGGVGEMSE